VSYEQILETCSCDWVTPKRLCKPISRHWKIRQALAESDPTNVDAQRDLWVSHAKIGAAQLQSGNSEIALQNFQQAVAIAETVSCTGYC
jgi:hypothetical protein